MTGLLIPRGDRDALRDGISRLLLDPELRQRMGEAGRRSYEAEFTRDAMIRKTRRVYLDVVGRLEVVEKSGVATDRN